MTWRRWGQILLGNALLVAGTRASISGIWPVRPSEITGVRLFSHRYLTRRDATRNSDGRELTAGAEQLHYLYTLTPVGEQRRKFLLTLAENDASHAESLYDLV